MTGEPWDDANPGELAAYVPALDRAGITFDDLDRAGINFDDLDRAGITFDELANMTIEDLQERRRG